MENEPDAGRTAAGLREARDRLVALGGRLAALDTASVTRPHPVLGDFSPRDWLRFAGVTTGITTRSSGTSSRGAEMPPVLRVSEITCPACGHRSRERMPEGACRIVHECGGCGSFLRPEPGDCCVFCSYGSVPCPPIQLLPPTARGAG